MRSYNEDGRAFIRKSAGRMKDWHEIQQKVEIPAKKTYGHGHKKKLSPALSEIIPVPEIISHFVMNLPATAIEFLGTILWHWFLIVDAFRGVYKGMEGSFQPHTDKSLPMIHVYCFQNPVVAEETILKEVREALGYEIPENALSIHDVRNVSPSKVSFPF